MPYDPIERWEWEGGAVAEDEGAEHPASTPTIPPDGRDDSPARGEVRAPPSPTRPAGSKSD
jgi:hypothetical protein